MGHNITAMILRGPFREPAANSFELQVVPLTPELTLFPVDIYMLEYWGVRTGNREHHPCAVRGTLFPTDDVLFDIAEALQPKPRFAVIQTDYFGGIGSQVAAVYQGREVVMEACSGGINAALRHLGVVAAPGLDEFDTVGLGKHRSFSALEDRDWDTEYEKLGLERP